MSEENPKFQQIVEKGRDLFFKYGIKRVSVEEICSEAAVSKVTFYKFFKNKVELAKYILQDIYDNALIDYREIMDSDISFAEKVEKTMKMKLDSAEKFTNEFLNDLYKGTYPELYQFLIDFSQKNMKMIRDDYSLAQQKGQIRNDLSIDLIMYFLNNMVNVATDENFIAMYSNPKQMLKEITTLFFYGIVSEEGRKN